MNISREKIVSHTADPYPAWPPGQRYGAAIEPGGLIDLPAARAWFRRLDQAREAGLYTFALPLAGQSGRPTAYGDRDLISFSTYGYLALNGHPKIVGAVHDAVDRFGSTTGGVRLLTGTTELHRQTESALAAWLGTDDTVLYNSGYDANLAAISSLFGQADVAFVDERAHRSLLDGCQLAGVRVRRFRHGDAEHLDELLAEHRAHRGRKVVIVDGVYSMDGDQASLKELVNLKARYGAFLLVDESHALGVLGTGGRGTCAEQRVDIQEIDIITSSLAKAFPSVGGLVAGSNPLTTYLRHRSAPFMFSSASAPANTAAILATLDVLVSEPEHLERLHRNSAELSELVRRVIGTPHEVASPIVPVILGDEARAYTWARILLDDGIYASAVPAPAVPAGQSRLRLCATAAHTSQDFALLEDGLRHCLALESAPEQLLSFMQDVTPPPLATTSGDVVAGYEAAA
ncbi:pyridoxal phosphate-dependent aminotransferase family protein [Parafrankia sp. EUN1f]|uniref:aminotransferase class I/II-fold pyridoxal phosphate-dependent enzyme n=1 Tax=Parafrankia sp. EUN1f TaxID=102897 RepID=UPI0001C47498|nr:pyridoxal phosphate-dependent aminotransferase family protein [Parafrankia sp. EUN1f]EFC79958.1 8-amino-7-oxononanoate synthase [Parafrankia sp. EUN1f]